MCTLHCIKGVIIFIFKEISDTNARVSKSQPDGGWRFSHTTQDFFGGTNYIYFEFGVQYLDFGAIYLSFGTSFSNSCLFEGEGGGVWVSQDLR